MKKYQSAIAWLYNQLPFYQRQGPIAYNPKLEGIIDFATHLGNPQNKIKCIHVAGTNGKGSVSHLLASVLQEHKLKVGLYTSPHLKDFRERIKINGDYIDKKYITHFISTHKAYIIKKKLTFFEVTVGMAYHYFFYKKIDIAVIEVGMGGRLDATNIITPLVSVITNIGLDHTQFLGNTLQDIAKEKAGIIKEKTPVIIGETQKETTPVLKKIATEKKVPILWADQQKKKSFDTDLLGIYQKKNIHTAFVALKYLKKPPFSMQNCINGFKKVYKNTQFQGRWQLIKSNPTIIGDVTHNREGFEYVFLQLKKEPYTHLHMVLGFVNEKRLDMLFDLFPKNASYYFCRPNIERGMDTNKITPFAKKYNLSFSVYSSVPLAYKKAKQIAKKTDCIYIGGSTFVVAEIL